MRTSRLMPTIGVEITGVDLSADLPDSTFAAIREAWLHHKVAVFPGQRLTEAGLMRFGRRFGDPFPGHYSRLLKRVSFRYPPEHRIPS